MKITKGEFYTNSCKKLTCACSQCYYIAKGRILHQNYDWHNAEPLGMAIVRGELKLTYSISQLKFYGLSLPTFESEPTH